LKFKHWFWSGVAVFLLTTSVPAQSTETLLKYITEANAWKASSEPKLYGVTNIDKFASSTGSTLKRYGLTGVTVQNWTGDEGHVRLTLYEMVDTSAAYGFFTFKRNPGQAGLAAVPLGTEGFRTGNRIYYWQSKYVVELEGDTKASESLGRLISQNILGRSRKPLVSDHLPPNNLVQDSEKYVVDAAGLDPSLGLDGGKLGFDDDVEVATGRYRINGKTASLVLLMYPTQHVAKKYMDAWTASSPTDSAFRKRVGPLVAWVRGTHDAELAGEILKSVGYESSVTWNQPRPDISVREIILTIFTFIGIALLFTFVAGVSFGGLRIFVKARYPDRFFDRSEDVEIIQLKLDQPFTRKEIGGGK